MCNDVLFLNLSFFFPKYVIFFGVKWLHPVGDWNGVSCVGSEVLNCFMYFAGLSTNFCHSMVAISAFAEKLWSTYTRFCLKGLVEGGPKEATNSINSSLLWDVFVLQKIEVCVTYYWIVGVFSLIELDVIVIVINRRLWLKTFCLYCYFSVFGGITDKCDDLWLLAV